MEPSREAGALFDRIADAWTELLPLYLDAPRFSGGMGFQRVKGIEYVVRYWQDSASGRKRMSSLGRRTRESEQAVAAFLAEREEHASRLRALEAGLAADCRLAKAHRFARMPADAAAHARALSISGMLGETVAMAGAAAAFGYEAITRTRADGRLVTQGIPFPFRFVVGPEATDLDLELVMISAAFDPSTASRTEHDGCVAFLGTDGRSVEFFDRSRFVHGAAPDASAVAVSRDSRAAPVVAVDPALWLEVEDRFPSRDPAADERRAFVDGLAPDFGGPGAPGPG